MKGADGLKSITEIAKFFGTSRQNVWNKIQSGEIKAIRFGKLWKISNEEFERLKTGINSENHN